MTRWWRSTGRRTKETRFLRSVTPYKRWPNRLPFRPCSRTKRVIQEVAHQRRRLPCKFPPCGSHFHASWCPRPRDMAVLSPNSIFGQNPKIGCQEFNDLQTTKLSKKQLCDRTSSSEKGM